MQIRVETASDINKTDSDGRTALWRAVNDGRRRSVRHLLKQGVDLDKSDHNGTTPLMLCVFKGNIVLLKLLLKHGANPFLMDKTGRTAQDYATQYKRDFITRLNTAKEESRLGISNNLRSIEEQYGRYQGIEHSLYNFADKYDSTKAPIFRAVYCLERFIEEGAVMRQRLIEAQEIIDELTPKYDEVIKKQKKILLARNGLQVQALLRERQQARQRHTS